MKRAKSGADLEGVDWESTYKERLSLCIRWSWSSLLVVAALRFFFGNWSSGAGFLLMWCVNVGTYLRVKKDGHARYASWIFICGLWLTFALDAVSSGMSHALTLWTMGLVPILTAYLTGPKYVVQAGAVAATSVSCVAGLDLLGVNPSDPAFKDPQSDLISVLMTFVYCQISYAMASSIKQKMKEMSDQGVELIQARFAADRSSLAKSAFLANMSQQIRQPLKAAMEDAQDLANKDLDKEGQEAALAIEQSSRRIWYIVNDIVEVSNMETGAFRLRSGPVVLSQVLAQARRSCERVRPETGPRIEFLPVQDKFGLVGDAQRIERVLVILLHDAIANAESLVRVECKVGGVEQMIHGMGARVEILVESDGQGYLRSRSSGLFVDLRSDIDERNVSPELGLGVSMAHRLVGRMQGHLSCSARPGQLSRMRVRLDMSVDRLAVHADLRHAA